MEHIHRLSNQITTEQRQAIVAALASKVPGPPTAAECAEIDKENEQMLAIIAKEYHTLASAINPKRPGDNDKVAGRRAKDGMVIDITADEARWRLSQLAYTAQQLDQLKQLAQSADISIKQLRRYAKMWRVWMVGS